jgi:hypothetical protein
MAPAASFCGPNAQWCDDNGVVLDGGFLYFYAAGTSTPADTFSDPDLTPGLENTNPIELDAAGRSPTAIYLSPVGYKVILKTSALVTVWTRDNYGVASPF